jgi:hypothetical protein
VEWSRRGGEGRGGVGSYTQDYTTTFVSKNVSLDADFSSSFSLLVSCEWSPPLIFV